MIYRFIAGLALCCTGILPAVAQQVTVIHNMTGADGSTLYRGLTVGNDGYLYGVASSGGANGLGSIFRISIGGTFTLLHSFAGPEGAFPYGSLSESPEGVLYGTTNSGGAHNLGNIYTVSVSSGDTPVATVTTVHDFSGLDGNNPYGGVSFDSDGNIYGAATGGGAYYGGTVYKIAGNGAFTVLHNFYAAATDGLLPYSAVTVLPNGYLGGSTRDGGQTAYGSFYLLNLNGSQVEYADKSITAGEGQWLYSDLDLREDGTYEGAGLVGGAGNSGTLFEITPNGNVTVLEQFPIGGYSKPYSTSTLAGNGFRYIAVAEGGSGNNGAVLSFSSNGTAQVIYAFSGSNGSAPSGKLVVGPDGNLYGTTLSGGANGDGVIYKITF